MTRLLWVGSVYAAIKQFLKAHELLAMQDAQDQASFASLAMIAKNDRLFESKSFA